MNQDFTVKKKAIFVWKKNFIQRGSPEKKNPAQAEGEKKIRTSISFLMVRPLGRYPQPDQRDISV